MTRIDLPATRSHRDGHGWMRVRRYELQCLQTSPLPSCAVLRSRRWRSAPPRPATLAPGCGPGGRPGATRRAEGLKLHRTEITSSCQRQHLTRCRFSVAWQHSHGRRDDVAGEVGRSAKLRIRHKSAVHQAITDVSADTYFIIVKGLPALKSVLRQLWRASRH
jgi:hypothetical protein